MHPFADLPSTAGKPSRATGCTRGWSATHPRNGSESQNFRRLGYPIESNRVEFIAGPVQDTLVVDEPVALANIDVDWYEPVTACLERIMPHLIVGGSVALRAYSDWSGCRKAADDYFGRAGKDGLTFDSSAGHLLVTKVR